MNTNQEILYTSLMEENFEDSKFAELILQILSKKLSIDQVLYFYDIAIKHQLLEFEKLNRKLINNITMINPTIKTEIDAISALAYFRETLSKDGKACHPLAEKKKKEWIKLYKEGKIKLSESYLRDVNPEAKEIIERILK